MTSYEVAIRNPCYLPEDTTHRRFYQELAPFWLGLTLNSGFE